MDEAANAYEVTIKKEKQGYFSNWLFSHDREQINLRVSEPQGEFIFRPEALTPALCLVAGIGITPAIAFARFLIRKKASRPLHIDYSVRSPEEAAFGRELTEWPEQFPNIAVRTRLTARDGHLGDSELRGLLSRYPGAEVYICGPVRYAPRIAHNSPGRLSGTLARARIRALPGTSRGCPSDATICTRERT